MQWLGGTGGHAPPGNLLNLDVLRSILLHSVLFGTLFYHDKESVVA